LRESLPILGLLAAVKLLLHLPVLSRYGMHGDELYFLACGERLQAGFADHPPFVPAVAYLASHLLEATPFALRLLPCLAGAATVVLTGLIVRELGGGRFAQGLAGMAILLGPFFLRTGNMLSIPSFEPFFWTLGSLLVVRILNGGDPRLWLAFGIVCGVGLMNKHSMLLYGLAVTVGLAATQHRRQFRSRWIWFGALTALLFLLPNLIWQVRHDWPTLDFLAALNERTVSRIPRSELLAGQVLYAGPGNVLLWLPGTVFLLVRSGGANRVMGWLLPVVLGVLLYTGGKAYYSLPVYAVPIAGGALLWERFLVDGLRRMRPVLVTLVALPGLLLMPFSLPIVSLEDVDELADTLTMGMVENSYEVTGDLHAMVGWEEQAQEVAAAIAELPAEDQERCLLWVPDYASAGALELYGLPLDLPPVLCRHLSYNDWTRNYLADHTEDPRNGEVVLALGLGAEFLDRIFTEVRPVGTVAGHPLANRGHRDRPLFLCRAPKFPLVETWQEEMWL